MRTLHYSFEIKTIKRKKVLNKKLTYWEYDFECIELIRENVYEKFNENK